jgi:hypothetical protein
MVIKQPGHPGCKTSEARLRRTIPPIAARNALTARRRLDGSAVLGIHIATPLANEASPCKPSPSSLPPSHGELSGGVGAR